MSGHFLKPSCDGRDGRVSSLPPVIDTVVFVVDCLLIETVTEDNGILSTGYNYYNQQVLQINSLCDSLIVPSRPVSSGYIEWSVECMRYWI